MTINWTSIQNDMDAGTDGPRWFFPSKNPNARVRLLQAPGDEMPFIEVQTDYQGKTRTKYLMYGTEAPNGPVRVIVLPKTALRAIVSLLANGWDLFDPADGVPVAISKYVTGGKTNYSVAPAGSKPMAINPELVEELNGLSLATTRDAFNEWQRFMEERRGSGVEDSD